MPRRVLVTGSSGLIGSEAVAFFDARGWDVLGVDNNMRRVFFGADGDTAWNLERLRRVAKRFTHHDVDIRRRLETEYVEQARVGDHICYISDLRRLRADYPGWSITRSLDDVLRELIARPAPA